MEIQDRDGKKTLVLDNDLETILLQKEQAVGARTREITALRAQLEDLRYATSVLRSLPVSWRERDPGKYAEAVWFLDKDCEEQVVVEELLPEGISVFKGDWQEWREYVNKLGYYKPLDIVPPDLPVVPFSEVGRVPCPSCNSAQPLIESYHQTYDSPEYDVWERKRLVVCCSKVHIISSVNSSLRMF